MSILNKFWPMAKDGLILSCIIFTVMSVVHGISSGLETLFFPSIIFITTLTSVFMERLKVTKRFNKWLRWLLACAVTVLILIMLSRILGQVFFDMIFALILFVPILSAAVFVVKDQQARIARRNRDDTE